MSGHEKKVRCHIAFSSEAVSLTSVHIHPKLSATWFQSLLFFRYVSGESLPKELSWCPIWKDKVAREIEDHFGRSELFTTDPVIEAGVQRCFQLLL